jgi:hypothetical protein
VQALIIMDFLLSLSIKAKEKLGKASLPQNANKSVMYADQTLSEEDVSIAFLNSIIPNSLFKFTNKFRQNGPMI